MDNAISIFERRNLDGSVDYVVHIGNFLYNNKIVSLSNVVIPIRHQSFFSLPGEKKYYAAINVYYSVEDGVFVYDIVKKSSVYFEFCDSDVLTNLVPIAQFIVQQSLSKFEVKKINLYSKMSTFTITDKFAQGDRGYQGDVGDTGFYGYTGVTGYTGIAGLTGYGGVRGETSVGMAGYTGMAGATGGYPDINLQLYLKFKADDDYLIDYSPYERDLIWGATGAGLTGIVYYSESGPSTVIEIIDQGQSSYTLEEGIIDNCHNVVYNGGLSGYKNERYIGFTGVIQAWVNVDQAPIPDFIYEQLHYTGMIGYPIRFINASLYDPSSVTWDINGVIYNTGIVVHTFGETGGYLVKLTVENSAGSHTKSELIMVA